MRRSLRFPTELQTVSPRAGNLLWTGLIAIVVLIAGLSGFLWWGTTSNIEEDERHLVMYTAAGTRAAVERVVKLYEEEYGVKVELQYGGSNTLLSQIQVNKFDTGDLYLAADDFYTDIAVEKGLAHEVIPIAYQRPVIMVNAKTELKIQSIRDLLDGKTSIALPDPEQAACGRAVRKALDKIESDDGTLWDQLVAQATESGVSTGTVNEAANAVKIGSVDAAIVWDATCAMPDYRDFTTAIPVAELDTDPNLICVTVLNASEKPTAALRFARFMAAHDRGLKVFKELGMRPVEGDTWAETPQLTFFCGAVNRKSLEPILERFQEREGVVVNTVYDGCGILTSRMETVKDQLQAQGFPDIYMACDRYYLDNVRDWFQDDVDVSETELVIVVPKGSTRIQSLQDLIEPGVRIAIGEPTQCTIGALTRRLLQQEGLYEKLQEKKRDRAEVVAEKASSALIVPDVTTGHVDAGIAYLTDVQANQDKVDVIKIESQLNKAVQPFSIAKTSQHKQLAQRFLNHLRVSREAFEAAGFEFKLGAATKTQLPAKD